MAYTKDRSEEGLLEKTALTRMLERLASRVQNLEALIQQSHTDHKDYSPLSVYADLQESQVLAGRLEDRGSLERLDSLTQALRRAQERFPEALDRALRSSATGVASEYESWLKEYEQILEDPDTTFIALEVEFESRLLRIRDFIEFAMAGLLSMNAGKSARGILETLQGLDSRLRRVLEGYVPRLRTVAPEYYVANPSTYPSSFWWRQWMHNAYAEEG